MPTNHKVVQGEYLSRIAARYGFTRPEVIWNDPRNAGLRKKRKSPNVLLPGDTLVIPDKADKQHGAGTTATHSFQVGADTVLLRVTLQDWDGEPLANADCVLKVGQQVFTLKTDGAGKLEKPIPVAAAEGTLTVKDHGIELPLKIGHLDPTPEPTGLAGRLQNLGYLKPGADPDPAALRCAVEEFQCDAGLKVDGVAGEKTAAGLEGEYGC